MPLAAEIFHQLDDGTIFNPENPTVYKLDGKKPWFYRKTLYLMVETHGFSGV